MALPLLLGARPPYVKFGAQVPLVRGEWEVYTVGLVDTSATLWSDRPPTHTSLDPLNPIKISGARTIRVMIVKAGSEESFSVFARKLS